MRKISIVIILLITVASLNLLAQQTPRVYDSLLVEDLAGGQRLFYFGLDSLATDGIDPIFGESDLPPFPPAGTFEARLLLPQNNFNGSLSSYKDFRVATFPFSGQKEFRFSYQVGSGIVIKITWNFPQDVTGNLRDMFGGTFIDVAMAGSGNYTVNDPDTFSKLKLFINYDASVPVELVSFNASVTGSSVNLDWVTATELNNRGFEIQRKTVNTDWKEAGFVEGAGTTTEGRSYSFTDSYSGQGTVSYRLKQIDLDGNVSYSKSINVDINVPVEFKLNQNYPNPFNPSTTISFTIPKSSDVKLNIFNQIGQKVGELVNNKLEAGTYNYNWNAENQSSGIYFYELQTNEFKSVRKMTLIK